MKKLYWIIICILILPVFSGSVFSTSWYEWLWGGELSGVHGNPVIEWYEISQWEVDVCFNWGGDEDPNEFSQNNIAGDYYHNLIISLQAEVSDPLGEANLTNGSKVYEVAWFIQPTDRDETIEFEVHLITKTGAKDLVESRSANYINGFSGYDVRESTTEYRGAALRYRNEHREGSLEIPFVS